ncbi:unnamed protein product, partial [Mesorhabditis spiculigera]
MLQPWARLSCRFLAIFFVFALSVGQFLQNIKRIVAMLFGWCSPFPADEHVLRHQKRGFVNDVCPFSVNMLFTDTSRFFLR